MINYNIFNNARITFCVPLSLVHFAKQIYLRSSLYGNNKKYKFKLVKANAKKKESYRKDF